MQQALCLFLQCYRPHHHCHLHLSLLSNCAASKRRSRYVYYFQFQLFSLTGKQPPGLTASSASTTEHTATANQILAHARSLRELLVTESTEASKKLSDATLDVILYTEKLESIGRLLTLADACIGQIRSRMRANSISIHPPSMSLSSAMLPDSVDGPTVSGTLISPY